MACKIPYIDNYYQGAQLTTARALHIEIGKHLREATDQDGDKLFPIRNGYIVLNNKADIRSEQEQFVGKIKNAYGDRTVQVLPAHYQGLDVVSVDVRHNIGFISQQEDTLSDNDIRIFGTDTVQGNIQETIASGYDEYLNEDPESTQERTAFFEGVLERIRDNLRQYGKLLKEGVVDSPDVRVKANKIQQQIINLNNEDLSTGAAIGNYVVQTSQWLDSIYNSFFRDNNSVEKVHKEIKELNNRRDQLTAEEREELDDKIRWVSKQINKSTHYMYLFNDLLEFNKELKAQRYTYPENNSITRSQEFYTDLNNLLNHVYESDVTTALKSIEFTEQSKSQIQDLVTSDTLTASSLINLIERLAVKDNPSLTADGLFAFQLVVKSTINKHKRASVEDVLSDAADKAEQLKTQLQRLHYDVVEEWLWPVVEDKQKNYTGDLKLTREQFSTLLRTGDKDEPVLKHLLDATVQSGDPLTAAVALMIGNQMYDAHQQTILESQKVTDVREDLKLEKNMSREEINRYHNEMTHQQLYAEKDSYGNLQEVAADYEGDKIQIKVFNRTIFLKAAKKKAFLSEYNEALYDAHQSYFYQHVNKEIRKLYDMLPHAEGKPDLTVTPVDLVNFLTTSDNPVHQLILRRLFYIAPDGSISYNKFTVDTQKPYGLWNQMKAIYQSDFYSENRTILKGASRTRKLEELGFLDVSGKEKLPKELQKHVNRRYLTKDDDVTHLREQLLKGNYPHVASYEKGENVFVLVLKNNQLQWINVTTQTLDGIDAYYTLRGAFTPLSQRYHYTNAYDQSVIDKWNTLNGNAVKKNYYDTLLTHYRVANDRLGRSALQYNILPQVEKLKQTGDYIPDKSTLEKIVSWFKKVFLGEEQAPEITAEEKTAYQEEYINGDPVLKIPVRFISHVNDEVLEEDLYRSVLMYGASAGTYANFRKIEPQIQVLKRVIKPDVVLGMQGRMVKDYDAFDRMLIRFGKKHNDAVAERLNQKLTEFINDVMYGQDSFDASVSVLGNRIDLQKLTGKISGYTAFSNLAWNVSSMFQNVTIGNLQNYTETIGKGMYSKEDYASAQKEYWLNTGNFIKDLKQSNYGKKSLINQLAVYFDAIQGEFIDENGDVSRTGNTEKMMERALFWTSAAPEHQIQITLMIALMKGYKLPSGKSLWESVQHKPGEMFEFPSEVSPELLRDFRNKLHSTNKKLHGHYSKFDKALIQRRYWGKLLMMFKKYLYSSVRHRFGDKRFDWEAGDETSGYLRDYFKMLLDETKTQKGLLAKTLFGVRNFVIKPYAGILDQLTFGQLSKNSAGFSAFAYGTPEQQNAAKRASFDMMMLTMISLFIIGIEAALDDDDEEGDKVLKNIEVFLLRLEGDLGMYLPFFVSPRGPQVFTTVDKAMQLVKSPLAQLRAYDASVKVLSQLWEDVGPYGHVWWDSGFEQYDRSGAGYEKGDYKISRNLKKSLLAPYWQIMRLLNPDEQLQYMNLSRKNSR